MLSVAEKLEIVAAYEAAPHGSKGEVLRRFNVIGSNIPRWAYARDHDLFGPGRTGRKVEGAVMTPKKQSAEITRLRRELAKAEADQEVLAAALESLGKAHALLEKVAESAEPEPLRTPYENTPSQDSSTSD
jgi:transposase-like protein